MDMLYVSYLGEKYPKKYLVLPGQNISVGKFNTAQQLEELKSLAQQKPNSSQEHLEQELGSEQAGPKFIVKGISIMMCQ